ncbi:MAG: flagellar hook-associated protein FlgK [Hydrogenophilales bacterium]|nr:flagellar hook-associated protein FlgK [Hydrogenophilales bacterium]
MAGIYGIGVQALNAAQLSLLTTEHNISNVNSPGFHRQEVLLETNFAQSTGSGFIGQGAQVETIRRLYDHFLDEQVLSSSSQSQFYDTYYSAIKQIDSIIADPNAGLSPAVQDFFKGVNTVANDPTSVAGRQSLLSGAEALVSRFQSINARLDDIRNGIDTQLDAVITNINSYGAQISALNQNIVSAQSLAGQPPNDLLDQRDQLIAKLNEQIRVTTVTQDDGSYNIFIGNGQSLVVGASTFTLALQNDPADLEQKNVVYSQGGSYVTIPQTLLENGGVLGGLISFRRNTLEGAQNALGRVSIALAQTVNNQNQLGQDLNGALGANLFSLASTSPTIYANTGNSSSGAAVLTATLSSGAAGALTTSNYTLQYNSASSNYTLTQVSDGTVTTIASSALPATTSYGFTIALSSGTPTNGDQWLLLPTRFGARDISVATTDPNKIAAAAPIRTAEGTANTGAASINLGSVNTASQPPLNSNLQNSVTITFTSASSFTVTDTTLSSTLATGVSYTSGGSISYNGWTVAISGVPATSDTFTIASNTGGIGDNRNALALAALQTSNKLANNTSGTPTTTYQGAYAQLVSSIGNKTRESRVNSAAQQTLLNDTKNTQQQLSGVNLDEEAANLLRFQQAYQAAAKMVQIGSTLFDTILGIR